MSIFDCSSKDCITVEYSEVNKYTKTDKKLMERQKLMEISELNKPT